VRCTRVVVSALLVTRRSFGGGTVLSGDVLVAVLLVARLGMCSYGWRHRSGGPRTHHGLQHCRDDEPHHLAVAGASR
jgi:hypothetical protein